MTVFVFTPERPLPGSDGPIRTLDVNFWLSRLRVVEDDTPLVPAVDLSINRADGVFETLGYFDGEILNIRRHLERMQASAKRLDLPPVNLNQWRVIIETAARSLVGHRYGMVKAVYARGVSDELRAWVWVSVVDSHPRQKHGVHLVTLDRGYAGYVPAELPWLLAGAKTLAYAINMAAVREARRRGADDAVFISTDRLVLEASTSNVVIFDGRQYLSPPPEALGILRGTTQTGLFAALRAAGQAAIEREITLSELQRARRIWLVSSLRIISPVLSLDAEPKEHDAKLDECLTGMILKEGGDRERITES